MLAAMVGMVATGCNGCHEEPTIVIRFEPTDADVKPPSPIGIPSPMATPTPSPSSLGGAPLGGSPKKSAKKECKAATDCVVVPEECCDCANGGKQHAIPKAELAAAKASRAVKCKHAMCTMMFSTDPTCGMRADCVSGQCAMVKK
jgi:hypothetical protein